MTYIYVRLNSLIPMKNVTKAFSCCETFVHERKIIVNMFEQFLFLGSKGRIDVKYANT